VPYIPHLTHYVWLHPDGDFAWGTWLALDSEWLRLCDALFFIGSSPGADMELVEARRIGLDIYTDLNDVPCQGGYAGHCQGDARALEELPLFGGIT